MNREVGLGCYSPSHSYPVSIIPTGSVDVKRQVKYLQQSSGRSCVKVEVATLGSPSLIVLMVSVVVKQQ